MKSFSSGPYFLSSIFLYIISWLSFHNQSSVNKRTYHIKHVHKLRFANAIEYTLKTIITCPKWFIVTIICVVVNDTTFKAHAVCTQDLHCHVVWRYTDPILLSHFGVTHLVTSVPESGQGRFGHKLVYKKERHVAWLFDFHV